MLKARRSIRLYHITHVDNLQSIVRDGALLCDSTMRARDAPLASIGMSHIKQRRLLLPVSCHPGTQVGEYVPFYYCPRSVMLYLINKGNSPDLAYAGGQDPILHLELDFDEVVYWAESNGKPWAIATTNAGAVYTQFYKDHSALQKLDWNAIGADDWRAHDVREHKQAELLVYGHVPWTLVRRIGVNNNTIRDVVMNQLGPVDNPLVEVLPQWYY